MNIFKLLLKNAIRIIKKTKVLTIQLCAITLIAVTVISSIFISNKTLRDSYDNVKKEGNIADFSMQNIELKNNTSFLIGKNKDSLEKYDNTITKYDYNWSDVVSTNISSSDNLIYKPYVESNIEIFNNNDQKIGDKKVFGYYKEYFNDNLLPNQWEGIIYSQNDFPISLNTDLTNINYKKKIKNTFSFYKDVFSPLESEVINDNTILYDYSNYATNPWGFKLNADGSLGYSEFGFATVNGFYNSNTFSFNQGLIYNNWSLLVGTDKLADNNISIDEITQLQKEVFLNENSEGIFASPSSVLGVTKNSTKDDYLNFQYGIDYDDNRKYYSDNFIKYVNDFVNDFKNNYLIQSPGYINLHYKIDEKNSENKVKFITSLYNSKKLPEIPNPNLNNNNNPLNTRLPEKVDPYFSGTIKLPLIPYITLKPTNNLFDYKNPQTWKGNSEINNEKLIEIFIDILNKFSKMIIEKCENIFNFLNSDVKYKKLIDEYNEKYDYKEILKKEKVNFSITNNITTNNITGDNFVISTAAFKSADDLNPVNALVIKDGTNLYKEEFDKNNINKIINYYTNTYYNVLNKDYDPLNIPKEVIDLLTILKYSQYFDSEQNIKQIYETIDFLLTTPNNQQDIEKYKQARTFFTQTFLLSSITFNGYGLDIKLRKQTIPGVLIGLDARYLDKTSYLGVVSENYEKIKNNNKKILPKNVLNSALKLPFSQRKFSIEEINNNIEKFHDNFILNPITNKIEFYNDFLSWFANLDPVFKLDSSGGEVVVIGTGITPEFIYPILNKGQFVLNNNNPIVFGNNSLFNKLSNFIKTDVQSNVWGKFNSSNLITNNLTLNSINKWNNNLYHKDLAYLINDPKQPNGLLYTRINFPIQIMDTVFSLTITLAIIISILSLFFISTLLRSIIKQNLNIIAIAISNGITKIKIALSFFSFAIIPGILSSLIAIGLAQFVFPIINSSIADYWILQWDSSYFNVGLLFLLPLITSIILFLILIIVIFITVRQNLTTLLTSHVEFRMNKLIEWTKPLISFLSPITSFRLSYVMGNITRFIVLLLMMTFFIVTTSTFVSTISVFDRSIQQTLKNRNYTYAINLISPTEQGGYYFNIPINKIGQASQGLIPNIKFGNSGVYDDSYKPYFTYTDPLEPNNKEKQVLYDSLFAISADLVSEIHGNIQFFRNRILTRNAIDINVNFIGNNINPWLLAQQTLPPNITSIADTYYNDITNTAFEYYLFIDKQKDPKYDFEKNKKMWLLEDNGTTLLSNITNPENQEIYKDPRMWKQDNWIYQYVLDYGTNKYKWQLNINALTGLPTFELKKKVIQLWVNILALNQNPNFIEFNKTRNLFKENFYLALNVVPFDNNLNETYSYIQTNSEFSNNKEKINIDIMGIKTNSEFVKLYNEYENNIDIKFKLKEWEENNPNLLPEENKGYPVIINEVVSKKYGLNIGSVFSSEILNPMDRFTKKFNNIALPSIKFYVIGITTSKSDEKIYTSQLIANKILNYKKPEKATPDDIKNGNYNNKWISQEDIDKYIPFNGIFTKEEKPILLKNFATMYSVSGLSPLAGSLPEYPDESDASSQLHASWNKINKILNMNIINPNDAKNYPTILKFINEFKRIFETDKYIELGITNLDAVQINKLLGQKMDNTTGSIMLIMIVSFLPTLMIIVSLLALMVVIESRRLISLLKVLGYGNISNTFSLTTSYFILLFLSLGISVGITQLILYAFSSLIFLFFNIIINPVLVPWIFALSFGVLFLLVLVIWTGIYFSIKNTNVPQVISIR